MKSLTLPLILLVACEPGGARVGDVTPGGGPAGSLSVDAQAAFDPVRGPLGFTVEGKAGQAVTVVAESDGVAIGSVSGTLDGSGRWTGTWDASADPPSAGPYVLVARAGEAEAHDDFAVVRPGFSEARWADDGGALAHREPLYWRGGQVLQDVAAAVATTTSVDAFPDVSADIIWAPTDGSGEPVAYRYDSRPILELSVPTATDLGATGLEDAVVEVAVDGWTALDGARLEPGGTVRLQLDGELSDSVGVTETDLLLSFAAVDGDRRWELGSQWLPVRMYRVLGPQTTGFDRDDAHPWVAAIDPALRAIDGTYAAHGDVVDALVAWIYRDLGLRYDTAAGASFYSDYDGFQWDQPRFYLTDFLQRRNGDTINCSDSANILATHANLIGAELVHIVILENYNLNEIKAIGGTEFTSCPFGPWGGCGFSYHAVTTNDPGGATVWDTTLALDGDANPGAAPSTELLVQSLTGAEYLDRLVRSGPAAYESPARITFE